MFAVTGITGKVGGATARALLAAGLPVRAVLRDASKAAYWAERGCEVAIAEMEDAEALGAAFKGARGVFILPPSCFDPKPGFPEARAVIDAVARALETASPDRAVCLSTVGAHSSRPNLLSQRTLIEQELYRANMPVTFLRPAWFMENVAWDIAGAKADGMLHSFLQPLDRAIPMVATADIGRVAAELLQQDWVGKRVVELEGPEPISPRMIAATLAQALGRPVVAQTVPRDTWESLFRRQGMSHPVPRIQMLDGFNDGWLAFERTHGNVLKGIVQLDEVVRDLIA